MKKIILLFGKIAVVSVAMFGLLLACLFYPNWSAEREAKAFCDEIAIGSDVSLAVERAKEKRIFFGDFQGYTFYFPGLVFDKAVCEVSVDANRKVISKASIMEYD